MTAEDVIDAAADSAEIQVWGLVDSLVARDRRTVFLAFLELREQGEAVGRLIPLMARRLREVLAIADRLEAGESPAQVKSSTKGSPWALDRRIKEARATDPEALRRAIETLADLELQTRGMGELERRHRRHPRAGPHGGLALTWALNRETAHSRAVGLRT